MAWKTDSPESLTAVAYTRDYSAQSVFDELKDTGGEGFSDQPEYIHNYGRDGWKVYKITITIEPAIEE